MSTPNLPAVVFCFDNEGEKSAHQQSLKAEIAQLPDLLPLVNKAITVYPGTIVTVLPKGYTFANELALEKIVKKIISANLAIKAVYSDVEVVYPSYSYIEYSQGYPATFFNPGQPFLERDFGPEIVARIKQGNIVYYYPEVLFKCHMQ